MCADRLGSTLDFWNADVRCLKATANHIHYASVHTPSANAPRRVRKTLAANAGVRVWLIDASMDKGRMLLVRGWRP